MELSINNNITKEKTNTEIEKFTSELSDYLNKVNTDMPELYKAVFNDVPLAPKYKRQLNMLIKECLEEESYESDFYYLDFDKSKNKYYLDYYSDGERERTYLTKKDLEGIEPKAGMFYGDYDDTHLVEADYLTDSIKINMESKLHSLDLNKNKEKAVKNGKNRN